MKHSNIAKWCTAVTILVMLFTGCVAPGAAPGAQGGKAAAPAASQGGEILGLSLFLQEDPFFQEIDKGARQAAAELKVDLDISYAEKVDQTIQLKQMHDLTNKPVKALLVYPINKDEVVPGIQEANNVNVPILTLGQSATGGTVVSHINDAFPPSPFALGRIAVETAVHYLRGEKVEPVVHIAPAVILPVPGTIVPPPTGVERERAKNELEDAMTKSGIDPAKYRTDAVVIYPGTNVDEAKYLAAPINKSFPEWPKGEPIMVWYDRKDEYKNGTLVYEVTFSDDKIGPATLFNPEKKVTLKLDAKYADQKEIFDVTWAFFVEGSCYGCGCCDGVCGCLICIP